MKKILRGIKSIVEGALVAPILGLGLLFVGWAAGKKDATKEGVLFLSIGISLLVGIYLVVSGLVLKNTVEITIGVIFLIVGFCVDLHLGFFNGIFLDENYTLPVREIYTYKGENVWEAAAEEYRKISGKPEDAELTEEEKKKIYDYTMMPMSYFFGWLCKRRLLGKGFAKEVGREKATDIQKRIKDGRSTPQEILAELEYRFSEDWVDGDAKNFLLHYFKTEDCRYDGSKDRYPYDYYECNGEPEDRYFCLEYSREIQKKMNERLDARYEEYDSDRKSSV